MGKAREAYNEGYEDGRREGRQTQVDVVETAIAQIRRGDTIDAITTLEREFWPKWDSPRDSEAAFRAATQEAALGAVA